MTSMLSRGNSEAGAVFSGCLRYRYRLWRNWNIIDGGPRVVFLMLNPSTADEMILDPTVTRCRLFAERWGHGGLEVLNLFAYRATDPKAMKAQADPVGPENDATIRAVAKQVHDEGGMIICAWGQHGRHRDRAARVLELLDDVPLYYLRMGANDCPWHPLYLPGDLTPTAWERV